MSKKLAIKGHPTRGNEVIELFKMMGGDNRWKASGEIEKVYYSISNGVILYGPQIVKDTVIFTLEEFLEKYPFKIGDKVIDKADGCPGIVDEMKWDEDVSDMKYCVAFGNSIDFGWFANDSIEFCKENKNLEETQSKRDIDKAEFMIKHMILPNKVDDKLEYEIIDGYEFDKVENNKIILKPIKTKYPTTYEECWKVRFEVGGETTLEEFHNVSGYYSGPLGALQKLLCCRDAYWKIAGEEMGLDKPWEPDWNDSKPKYTIVVIENKLVVHYALSQNYILAFPTEEMRDAFYKNFGYLIEQCKELL